MCLNFVYEVQDSDSYQEVGFVNYPNDSYFTRIAEFKKLTQQKIDGKIAIMNEYPRFNGEKCYPYPTQEYLDKFKLYTAEMKKEKTSSLPDDMPNTYFNMDLVVKEGLEIFENKIR